MMDPNKWTDTLPKINTDTNTNQEQHELDRNKWENTLPEINKNNSFKKYSIITVIFVIGIISVSIIKNEARNLEKKINNLQQSINTLKINLHQATLDHEVITSPENVSRLAREYLDLEFNFYKKSQIRELNEEEKILSMLKNTKNKRTFKTKDKKSINNKIKLLVTKQVENKKVQLKKLKKAYKKPEEVPKEIKLQIAKKIEKTKIGLKKIYSSPKDAISLEKAQKWTAIQIVKIFLGFPVVPGK